MKKFILFIFFLISMILFVFAQNLTPIVVDIPMRDGNTLKADIYLPDTINPYPTILIQTPYSRLTARLGLPLGIGKNLSQSPYAFVVVDWRCFWGSAAACTANPNRGEDGYDVVEWIATQTWSNGRIGTWGPSALGRIQFLTAKENPPSLDCIVPLVAGSQTNYEEYFPGGVARTEYIAQLENLGFGGSSIYYSNPVKNIVWDIVENGAFYPGEIHVPAMMIGGWYDHNVIVMMELFPAIQSSSPPDVRDSHRLLMGPWVHGGTGPAYVGSKVQGELEYPEAEKWSDSLARVFLDHWLRDLYPDWENSPKVQYFQMGENQWQTAPTWPPDGVLEQTFFLHPDQSIQSFPVSQSSGELSFSYDPQDPSPTDGGPTLSNDLTQGPVDQRKKVENRNDILIFTSDPFHKPVRIQGKPHLELMVSSDQPDTDFAVRLTDVYPDGRSMLLVDGIRRMRFRNGFRATDTMVMNPGEMYSVTVEMPDLAHTFLPGHQMRVNITSSNYPRFNRNMNTGKEMYPNANGDTLVNPRVATNTVFLNAVSPSRLILPITDSVFTGIDQNMRNELGVRIIPNPTQGYSHIEFSDNRPGEIEITIYSMPGQKVRDGSVSYSGGNSFQLDLSGLEQGYYWVQVAKGGKKGIMKLVKY